jgi:hypothetical protein
MSSELQDTLTPITPADLLRALWRSWIALHQQSPHPNSLLVLIAHWALETGWGKSCHCYNLGNVKSSPSDSRDYCYFECGEEIPQAKADAERKAHPDLIRIKRAYTGSHGVQMASIVVLPKHPWSRFRAFARLDDGARDYLVLLRSRFDRAWPAVLDGDPGRFVDALKSQGYFTANIEPYRSSVVSIYNGLTKSLAGAMAQLPDVGHLDLEIDNEMRARTLDLVAMTLNDTAQQIQDEPHPRPDDEEG